MSKIKELQKILTGVYGPAKCTLEYEHAYELLFATILAAQCTDERVNIVTGELYKKYKTLEDFAVADPDELMSDIRSCGFYRNKALNIIKTANKLVQMKSVPDTMDELLKLPGVGRKTANLILAEVYGKPALIIDTHAKRLTKRIGLTKETDPTKIEMDLLDKIPPSYRTLFCHHMVYHGRACCKSMKPACTSCQIAHLCDEYSGIPNISPVQSRRRG